MKPREWKIFGIACVEKGSAAYDNFQWNEGAVHAIEYAAFEKLEAERDTLKAKLAEVEAERERLEDLLGAVHDTTLEADTKSRIANNLDATPNGWRFRKSQLTREREAAKVMREALSAAVEVMQFAYMNAPEQPIEIAQSLAAIAKADKIRGGE